MAMLYMWQGDMKPKILFCFTEIYCIKMYPVLGQLVLALNITFFFFFEKPDKDLLNGVTFF